MDKYRLIVWFIVGMVFAYMTVAGYTWYHNVYKPSKESSLASPAD